ncbi:hypothetical protein [Aquibacillus kalidii]|uniref:hypothetical protein n=1 Tax=Aquibacillus kalidii TaxID=2762597 RepID=UPI00164542AF|nr:hypothetical protein [Aquibacillus kalidii]
MPKLREQLQNMTFKQKVEHIWEYYKFPIIGTIVGIVMIVSLVTSIMGNEESFQITVINEEPSTIDEFTLADNLNNNFNDFNIIVDMINAEGSFANISFEESQKLLVRAASGDIDLLMLDENVFKELLAQEAFAPLDQFLSLDELEIKKQSLFYGKSNIIYGISTSDIPNLEQFSSLQDKVLCVFGKVSDKEDVKQFLSVLFKN